MVVNIYLAEDYKHFEENQQIKIDDDLLIPLTDFYGEAKNYVKVKDDYDILYYVEKRYIDIIGYND